MRGDADEGSVREVFAAEAADNLATLKDEAATLEEKRAAAANLREGAALVGEHAIAHAAADLVERGASAGGVAALEARVYERLIRPTDVEVEGDLESEEAGSLRRLFRDEADETLERIATTLAELGDRAPGAAVLRELMRMTHTLKGSAATVQLGAIGEASHALEDAFDALRGRGDAWSQRLCDQLVELVDALRAAVSVGDRATQNAQIDAFYGLLSRLELPRGQGSHATERGADGGASAPPALSLKQRDAAVLRVDAKRIDSLMDSVGELAFDRTRITRRATEISQLATDIDRARRRLPAPARRLEGAEPDEAAREAAEILADLESELDRQLAALRQASGALLEDADALRRTGKALQDGLTRVRMLTVSSLFRQLAPQLRAMARAAGKRIRLVTSGGDTEFDKAVATHVIDALLQLLRNAVAHGIEPPETRRARGKPTEGRVTIAARQEGSTIVLDVSDDGAGIDVPALRRRFIERGAWTEARAELASDNEVIQALFEPGTSQRERADSLAGRGVGLSAVRESVARLGGEVQTRSIPEQGTRFRVRLPVTAAVSQALLFKVGGDVFALPQSYVVETAHVDATSLPRHLNTRSRTVPLVGLHQVLEAELPADARSLPAVVLAFAGKQLAITCDKIVGPREIVIKQLGPILSTLPLYAGGTISGSGKVQLIFDPAELVRIAFPEGAGPPGAGRDLRPR